MKLLNYFLIPLILAAFLLASCSDDPINSGGGNIYILDPTVTHTDQFGNVLGGDTTDWCSNSNTLFEFNPAFPNPTHDTVKLRFQEPG